MHMHCQRYLCNICNQNTWDDLGEENLKRNVTFVIRICAMIIGENCKRNVTFALCDDDGAWNESSSCVEGSVSGCCVPLSVLACSSIITLMMMVMMMMMMMMIGNMIVISIITFVVFIQLKRLWHNNDSSVSSSRFDHDCNDFQELNAVYNLNLEKDIGQAHLLQAAQVMMLMVMVIMCH